MVAISFVRSTELIMLGENNSQLEIVLLKHSGIVFKSRFVIFGKGRQHSAITFKIL